MSKRRLILGVACVSPIPIALVLLILWAMYFVGGWAGVASFIGAVGLFAVFIAGLFILGAGKDF